MSLLVLGKKSRTNGLRPLKPSSDLFGVAKLIEEAFAGELDRTGKAALREMRWIGRWGFLLFWLDLLSPDINTYLNGFVWIENQKIVGNTTVSRQSSNTRRWFISNVAVAKAYRGRGIARTMMEASLAYVREMKGQFVSLQVKKDNVPAVHLYESLKFETTAAMSYFYCPRISSPVEEYSFPDNVVCRPHNLTNADARAIFSLARLVIPPGIQQERPLQFHQYRLDGEMMTTNFFRRLAGFGHKKYMVVQAENGDIIATLSIEPGTWRREHKFSFMVHPQWQGVLEKPLISLALQYLTKLPPRPISFQHPATDEFGVQALIDAGFVVQRTHLWMTRHL